MVGKVAKMRVKHGETNTGNKRPEVGSLVPWEASATNENGNNDGAAVSDENPFAEPEPSAGEPATASPEITREQLQAMENKELGAYAKEKGVDVTQYKADQREALIDAVLETQSPF
jgi:hypothetical protein